MPPTDRRPQMIRIQYCPRPGPDGWFMEIGWDGRSVDVLLVGSHDHALDRAHQIERELKAQALRHADPAPVTGWRAA